MPAATRTRLSFRRCDSGPEVVDLQRRLVGQGFSIAESEGPEFGESTDAAVRAFQSARGLVADGVCGPQTWSTLVEAGFRPGDRLLYLHNPMQRGDDVAEVQRRLSALGFHVGRVDGIFGSDTAWALREFQRAAAIHPDGVCGPTTLTALARLGIREGAPAGGTPVADVREREHLLSAARELRGRTIAIGHPGGLDAASAAVARSLAGREAESVVLPQLDGSEQAEASNELKADLYVGLAMKPESTGVEVAYWKSPHGHESAGGRRLAEILADSLAEAVDDGGPGRVSGMALPVLRETRMTGVKVTFGPALVPAIHAVAEGLAASVQRWCEAPIPPP